LVKASIITFIPKSLELSVWVLERLVLSLSEKCGSTGNSLSSTFLIFAVPSIIISSPKY
jgi:hypothetical protein